MLVLALVLGLVLADDDEDDDDDAAGADAATGGAAATGEYAAYLPRPTTGLGDFDNLNSNKWYQALD